jgi:uncharacterized protein (DUF934 family)
MPLIKNGVLADDPWIRLEDGDTAPDPGDISVSLDRWQAEQAPLSARSGRLGIRLKPDQPPHLIAEDLTQFALIALEFPAFKDGRAYSQARVLRERYGFKGELRATGEVLRDQLFFMARCGFDAFEVTDGITPEEWRAALAEFSAVYQPAADTRHPAYELRHAARAAAE